MRNKMKNKNQGFTLIELMITVMIVGILSGFAMNSYGNKAIESRRADAKSKLLEVMQRQERFFSENNTYTANLTALGYSSNPVLSDSKYYSISAAANATGINDGVILTAAPQGAQAKDTKCASLILNSNGQKTSSVTAATGCW